MRFLVFSLLFFACVASAKSDGPTCEENLSVKDRLISTLFGVSAKPWNLSVKAEADVQAAFAKEDSPDFYKMREVIAIMLIDRAERMKNQAKAEGLYSAIASSFNGKIQPDRIPLYDPNTNKVHIAPLNEEALAASGILHIHELDHAFMHNFAHRRSVLLGYVSQELSNRTSPLRRRMVPPLKANLQPILQYRMEQSAIGAQWELVHRMPEAFRLRLLRELDREQKRDPFFNKTLHTIMVQSLKHANLSKPDFISTLEPFHSYTLDAIRKRVEGVSDKESVL